MTAVEKLKKINIPLISVTVKPLYYGHQGERDKCPQYRGVRFGEIGFIWISVSQGPSELSVIERCPYQRGVRKERFHCTQIYMLSFIVSIIIITIIMMMIQYKMHRYTQLKKKTCHTKFES